MHHLYKNLKSGGLKIQEMLFENYWFLELGLSNFTDFKLGLSNFSDILDTDCFDS